MPNHISKMVLFTVHSSLPDEARTPRKDRYAKDHRAPNHISKTVPPTVHLGPADRDRTSHEGDDPSIPSRSSSAPDGLAGFGA